MPAPTTAPPPPAVSALIAEIASAERAIESAYYAAPRGGPDRNAAAERYQALRVQLKQEHGYLYIDGAVSAPGEWTPCTCSDC